MSASDVDKWGPTIGFRPDTPAYVLSAAASLDGNGLTNNRDTFLPIAADQFNEPNVSNLGFLNRKRETTAFSANAGALAYGGIAFANASSTGKNFYTASPAAGGVGAVYYSVVLCTIRLSDLCDFFTKVPLIRGGFFRLTIVYNSSAHLITLAGGPVMSVAAAGTTIRSGRTCPYIFSSATVNNSANLMVAAAQGLGANISIDSGVVRTTQINNPGGPFSSCRLYVPAYELDPVKEAQLLQIKPIRSIDYFDVYQYQFGSVAAGDNFNQLITNGISGMRYLVVIPSYSYSDATVIAAGAAAIPSAALSPFDTFPGTGHPLAAITNFNVQVGGRNLFQQNFQYNFEFFMNEMARINAINGGVEMGLTSGLITQSLWDNGYRFYVCDLTRRPSIEDGVAKSVQILGQNATPYAMNFTCFIAYDKKVNIDMAEGKLVA
jgi:hypothetical protein